ncbi:MAG: hypothetical protein K2H30_00075 [Clostridia bacterium]|nr:hypothetical protein [Clostridia bacterium]
MRFQKYLILVTLIVAALSFVYALSFCGGTIYQYEIYYDPGRDIETFEGVRALYNASQTYNDILIWLTIVFILVVIINYIMATQKRRNYYVTNYISIILTIVYAVALAAVIVLFVVQTYSLFILIDRESVEAVYNRTIGGFKYSTINFIMGYVMAGVLIANACLLIFNLVWKVKLMKGEKKLLARQPAKSEEVIEEAV